MAVVVVSPTRSSAALNNYVLNDKKDQKGERYVMASGLGGLLVSVAEKQMRDVRKKYNKDKPGAFVQAYHVIQSFGKDELDPDDPDSWLMAQRLGRALAEDRFPGRQVLVVTQRDGTTGCIHNHIVVNSVETKTGKSLNSSLVMHTRLVQEHDRVLAEQGFEQRADIKQAASDAKERFERGEPSRMRRKGETDTRELREFQRHILWEAECEVADDLGVGRNSEPFSVAVLKSYIAKALANPDTTDWVSFVAAGRKHGVDIAQRGQKGRGISYGMLRVQPDGSLTEPSASDRRRSSSLGRGYLMDDVEAALLRNTAAHHIQAATLPAATAVVHTLPAARLDQPALPKLSIKERMRAALEDVNKQADANTQRLVDEFLKAKAPVVEPQDTIETTTQPEQTDAPPVPANSPLSVLEDAEEAQEAQETDQVIPGAKDELAGAEAVSELLTEEEDSEMLLRINDRNRRLGLSAVSLQQHAANQKLSPKQRAWRLANPELFTDIETNREHSRQDRGFED